MEKIVSAIKDWFEKYQPDGTMIERYLWAFWVLWVLLILFAVLRVIKFRFGLVREKRIWGDGSGIQKSAAVIVPIKGVSPSHTSDFFQSLLEQNYSRYRLIVAVESSDDPAAEWLFSQFGISLSNPVWVAEDNERGFQDLRLVVAGQSKGQGQKVQNQLAAFEELNESDEIIVFVDADIICPPDWLAKLTAPINQKTHDPSTTYRWLIPKRATAPNLYASVINASVTTQGGNVRDNMPWGGSMAVSRETFLDLDIPNLFAGSLNDDLRLGKAAKKAGYKVGYVRNLVRPTEIDFSWFGFIEFARRQYLQVKVFAPILYFGGNLISTIYLWGFVSIVAALVKGYLWAWVPLIVATLLDQVRAMTRESIYRSLFGHDKPTYRKIARTGFIEHCLTPVYMILHGFIIGSTWFMRKVTWGGVRYKVGGVNKTRVLKRKAIESFGEVSVGELSLPAGAAVASGFVGTNFESNTTSAGNQSSQAATISDEVTEDGYIEETTPISSVISSREDTVDPTEPINVSVVTQHPRQIPAGASQFTIYDLFADVSAPNRDESEDAVSDYEEAETLDSHDDEAEMLDSDDPELDSDESEMPESDDLESDDLESDDLESDSDDSDLDETEISEPEKPKMSPPIAPKPPGFAKLTDSQSEEDDSETVEETELEESEPEDEEFEAEPEEDEEIEEVPLPPAAPQVVQTESSPVAAVAMAPSAVSLLGQGAELPMKTRHRFRLPGKSYRYEKKTVWKPGKFPAPRAVSYPRFRVMSNRDRVRMVRKLR